MGTDMVRGLLEGAAESGPHRVIQARLAAHCSCPRPCARCLQGRGLDDLTRAWEGGHVPLCVTWSAAVQPLVSLVS